MNPFTRFLQQWAQDKDLETFVEHCDALEALVVRVYKQGEASAADEAEYQALRRWMKAHYDAWRDELRPYWGGGTGAATASGKRAPADPFEATFAAKQAGEFVGDWSAMQQLPTAREALNRLILKRSGANV